MKSRCLAIKGSTVTTPWTKDLILTCFDLRLEFLQFCFPQITTIQTLMPTHIAFATNKSRCLWEPICGDFKTCILSWHKYFLFRTIIFLNLLLQKDEAEKSKTLMVLGILPAEGFLCWKVKIFRLLWTIIYRQDTESLTNRLMELKLYNINWLLKDGRHWNYFISGE